MALLDVYDAVFFDLDGTVWESGRALPNAVQTIAALTVPALYVTNNAFRAPEEVAEMLREIGIDATPDDVLTSAQAAVRMARETCAPGERVLVLGSDSFRRLTADAGFEVVASAADGPRAVLHGHNPATGWAELSEAALAIRAGAEYLASNLDTTLPTGRGLMVGNGSMVAAVTSATGVVPRAAGKPQPTMFQQAVEITGASRALAVGDRLDTDLAGAVAAGVESLHVLTGVSGPLALLNAPKEQRPTFIGADLSALLEDPDELAPGPQGGFEAVSDGNEIVLRGGNVGSGVLQALRTACDVAWSEEIGAGEPVRVRPESDAARRACDEWW